MRQILQSLRTGDIELADVPVPAVTPGGLVVETRASVLSVGTERMLVEFGRANLLQKARRQPERVREVWDKVRSDGLLPTLEAVRSKLEWPVGLGYCQAGVVRDVGGEVQGFGVGDPVVTNGGHAEYVRVPWTLAARIPDGVSFEAAAFTPLAAIGLQGLRLAEPTLGETVVVYGLGVIGLLSVQLARAHGCRVVAIDRVAERLALAEQLGARPVEASAGNDVVARVRALTDGIGADAVLLTLTTEESEPVQYAAEMSRKRGRLVLVGVAGLELRRSDFYEKELSLQVSCSYGPGRYDPAHEEHATDYPLPYVRWTEGRNFAAVLELMADGRLDPLPLVTHRFGIGQASEAYEAITDGARGNGASPLGVVLEYEGKTAKEAVRGRTVEVGGGEGRGAGAPGSAGGAGTVAREPARGVVGFIGAGNFAQRTLMPAFAEAGAELRTVVSSGGTSATVAAKKHGFRRATTDPEAVFSDPEIDTVVIATRHDTHAEYVLRALEAGKHVFVEKPLAIREEDIDRIEAALEKTDRILCVGFNRRFAPLTLKAKEALEGRAGPLVVNILVNAGELPDDHWTKDPEVGGGRLIGEACHFIDLARCFVGHPISDVDVTSARGRGGSPIEDVSLIQMAFADGSVATIQYLANGPAKMPKERVELFWEGKGVRIDDWRDLKQWGLSMARGRWTTTRRRGHSELVRSFLQATMNGGSPPIETPDLIGVSRWTLHQGAERGWSSI